MTVHSVIPPVKTSMLAPAGRTVNIDMVSDDDRLDDNVGEEGGGQALGTLHEDDEDEEGDKVAVGPPPGTVTKDEEGDGVTGESPPGMFSDDVEVGDVFGGSPPGMSHDDDEDDEIGEVHGDPMLGTLDMEDETGEVAGAHLPRESTTTRI